MREQVAAQEPHALGVVRLPTYQLREEDLHGRTGRNLAHRVMPDWRQHPGRPSAQAQASSPSHAHTNQRGLSLPLEGRELLEHYLENRVNEHDHHRCGNTERLRLGIRLDIALCYHERQRWIGKISG